MTTQEALPIQNQSQSEASKAIERRQPLGEQIAQLIGDKSSLVTFDDLRKAAIALGISAKRGADGKVGSGDDSNQVVVRVDPRTSPKIGDVLHVQIKPGEQHMFDSATGLRIDA